MVRRWSCLISINNNFNHFSSFKKISKINLFKTSVNFKRFTFKFSKFKRKSLIRIKHRSNLLIYTNVIKLWVKDYLFNKNYLKYQFLNKLFINNFFFYNFNSIKVKSDNFFYNFNFFFYNFSNKKYFYFYKNSNTFFGITPISFLWFNDSISTSNTVLPLYSLHETMLYPVSINKSISFDFNSLFEIFFSINLNKIIEIRKILTILFYFNLSNFKNVK